MLVVSSACVRACSWTGRRLQTLHSVQIMGTPNKVGLATLMKAFPMLLTWGLLQISKSGLVLK